jgi:hypothetical protein
MLNKRSLFPYTSRISIANQLCQLNTEQLLLLGVGVIRQRKGEAGHLGDRTELWFHGWVQCVRI